MVALPKFVQNFFRVKPAEKPQASRDSAREAYEFTRRVYNKTRGPTPKLRALYESYVTTQGEPVGPTPRTKLHKA